MSKTNAPKEVISLLKEVNLETSDAMWNCHGTWVMYHKSLERLAGFKKIKFDPPSMIHQDPSKKEVIILVTGHYNNVTEWSYGEATPLNNKNAYPYAMAEKRAKDRVILKLLGFHGDIYSDSEIDKDAQENIKRIAQRKALEKKLNQAKEKDDEEIASPNAISSRHQTTKNKWSYEDWFEEIKEINSIEELGKFYNKNRVYFIDNIELNQKIIKYCGDKKAHIQAVIDSEQEKEIVNG